MHSSQTAFQQLIEGFSDAPNSEDKNLDPGVVMGAVMVNGMLAVCSGMASTTL